MAIGTILARRDIRGCIGSMEGRIVEWRPRSEGVYCPFKQNPPSVWLARGIVRERLSLNFILHILW
jgi:hypothetical protein